MSDERPLSAIPSPGARLAAFLGIILGGCAGGIIGYALMEIQNDSPSRLATGLGLFIGSIVTAGGTAIIAVLILRALGEWRVQLDQQ